MRISPSACSLSNMRFVHNRQAEWLANERIFQNVPLYTNDAAKTLTASVLRRQLNETGSVRQSSQHVNHFNNTNTPTLAFFSSSLSLSSVLRLCIHVAVVCIQ